VSLGPPPVEFLRVTNLHAFYGESHILHGVDFSVKQGELVTLLGRNGSGRTTTLKAILGLTGRRTGSVMVNGNETTTGLRTRSSSSGSGIAPRSAGSSRASPRRRT
jgi:branched-chain amino acid transport system ATP-binding protein